MHRICGFQRTLILKRNYTRVKDKLNLQQLNNIVTIDKDELVTFKDIFDENGVVTGDPRWPIDTVTFRKKTIKDVIDYFQGVFNPVDVKKFQYSTFREFKQINPELRLDDTFNTKIAIRYGVLMEIVKKADKEANS